MELEQQNKDDQNEQKQLNEEQINQWASINEEALKLHQQKLSLINQLPQPIFQQDQNLQQTIKKYIEISLSKQQKPQGECFFESRFNGSIKEKQEHTQDLIDKLKETFNFSEYHTNSDPSVLDNENFVVDNSEYYEKLVEKGMLIKQAPQQEQKAPLNYQQQLQIQHQQILNQQQQQQQQQLQQLTYAQVQGMKYQNNYYESKFRNYKLNN